MEETPANDNAPADEVPVEEAPDPKAEEAKEEADDTEIVHVNGEVIDDQVAKTNPGSNDQADQDRERVRNAFHLFDIDGNGVISADELGTLLKTLGQNPSKAQIEELLAVNVPTSLYNSYPRLRTFSILMFAMGRQTLLRCKILHCTIYSRVPNKHHEALVNFKLIFEREHIYRETVIVVLLFLLFEIFILKN